MCASSGDDSGDSAGDSSDGTTGGGGGGGWLSTPFISTWDGRNFSLENDFLFSKPKTNRSFNLEDAKKMYENNINSGDKYIIQNKVKLTPEGNFLFQIKEIEPEVSYIDNLKISYFEKNSNNLYFVTSDHKKIVSLQKNEILNEKIKQSVVKNNSKNITDKMVEGVKKIILEDLKVTNFTEELLTDEFLNINVSNITNDNVYLILRSNFRNWTIGSVLKDNASHANNIKVSNSLLLFFKSPIRMLSLIAIFIFSYFGLGFGNKQQNNSLLSNSFDINVAYADLVSHNSLIVDGYDQTNYKYIHIETIEPRFYQPSSQIIKIPSDLINNGKLSLRVKATKKHLVSCAYVVQAQNEVEVTDFKELKLEKAYQRRTDSDFAELLSIKNKEYLTTWPGDIVDLEFSNPLKKNNSEDMIFTLEANGFYTAAPEDVQAQLGDWVAKLDNESKNILEELSSIPNLPHEELILL